MLFSKVFKNSSRELRRVSLGLIFFSLLLLIASVHRHYSIYKKYGYQMLNVSILNPAPGTTHLEAIGEDKLLSGTEGKLMYHPRSFFEKLLYYEYSNSPSYLDYLIFLAVGFYLLWISLTTPDEAFFTRRTHRKFTKMIILIFLMIFVKGFTLFSLGDYFYAATNHRFTLSYEPYGGTFFAEFILVALAIFLNLLFRRAIKIEEEQSLTI